MDYDLICLQETWLISLDITNFEVPDYVSINKPRSFKSKRVKRGSNTNTEDRVWIKFKEPSLAVVDVFCCFCYIPPINSVVMCNEASQWTAFELEVLNFSAKGKIIICGDMNARTGTLLDYIPHDTNIPTGIPCSYTIDRETPCLSKDTIVNIQGRHLLDLCISMGLRISNG